MNRTVLITGANGNLGQSVIKTLHERKYQICATVGSGLLPDEMESMVMDMQKVNLTDEDLSKEYIDAICRKYPDLHSAVLLVGSYAAGDIQHTDGQALDKQIALNFKTAYFIVRPLLDHFGKNGGGQIILIGTRPALQPESGKDNVAYALSKSLIFQLAKIINASGNGVSATVIVPSTIDSEENRKANPGADYSKWVTSADIAKTIEFILSDPGMTLRDSVLKMYNES